MTREERLQALEVDVDTRLARVWARVWEAASEDGRIDRDVYSSSLRAAYAEGYLDALREDNEGRRCELAVTNGYAPI